MIRRILACVAILGWAAFPAFLVALFLQAVLFQFGGLTTLGGPAIEAYLRRRERRGREDVARRGERRGIFLFSMDEFREA